MRFPMTVPFPALTAVLFWILASCASAETLVTMPAFTLNAGHVTVDARLVSDSSGESIEASISNTGNSAERCTISWDSPQWWREQAVPYRIDNKTVGVPAKRTVRETFGVPHRNWNPYNRYPITCVLNAAGQTSSKTVEICGRSSGNVRLGEPRLSSEIKDSKFGMVLNYGRRLDYNVLSKSGIKWVRQHVPIEYADGTPVHRSEAYFFEDYDLSREFRLTREGVEHIKRLQDLKINLLQQIPLPRSDKPEDRKKFQSYCRNMARILAPYGQKWIEIGNEPSDKWGNVYGGFWNAKDPSPYIALLCEMVKAGAKGCKEGNSNCLVGTGGGVLPASYRMLDYGLGPDVNAITDHPYSPAMIPELIGFGGPLVKERDGVDTAPGDHSFYGSMTMQTDKYNATGHPHLKTWVTEWGFSTYNYDGKSRMGDTGEESRPRVQVDGEFMFEGYTRDTQSKYIARRMLEMAALPVVTVSTMYQFVDDSVDPYHPEANFGAVEFGGFSLKPSYHVVQRVCSLFSDGTQPWPGELQVDISVPMHKLRVGNSWNRPHVPNPVYWEGKIPLNEPDKARYYAFKGQAGELVLAIWEPIYAQSERQPDRCDVTIGIIGYGHPIAIDILSGERRDLDMKIDALKETSILKNVWVPDYPVVIKLFPEASQP